MKASDLFIRCLEKEGVEYIFGVPGEENADMMMSLLDSPIEFVVCRHEQGAAFIADAYGRLTGKPAVCLGTLGPGATNLLTGVADANMDRAPLVVVTGQGATGRLHKESHQAMDVVSMFRPIVKWSTTVTDADAIPEIIRKAFKLATTEKMGATHIELPEDVAKHRTLARPLSPSTTARAAPKTKLVEEAVAALKKADFPVILAGNGVLRDRASEALTALADKTKMPVVNTFMGKGAIPASHPSSLFTVGLQARDFVAEALEKADVVMVVGYDMVEYHPKKWNRGRKKTVINLDFEPAEVDASFAPDIDLAADIDESLRMITQRLEDQPLVDPKRYQEYRDVMLQEFSATADDTEFPIKPQKILWDVRKAMADEDILLSDVGAHKMWIARQFQCDAPNTCLISNGFCTMGFALPGAIGAKLAYPDRNVMAICGDGGFLMNVQELETAVRLKLPFVTMIWNDSEYGLIKWKQEMQYGKTSHIAFDNPDFVKLAEAFGAIGLRVERTEDLPDILKQAFAADRPVLIDCPVDYGENMKLSRRLGEMSAAERTSWLKKVPIFSKCHSEHLEVLADFMNEESFGADSVIFNQGDAGEKVYIVVKGSLHVKPASGQAREVGPGSCVGEMAVLADQPRSATVTAGSDGAEALTLSAHDFREILHDQPEIGMELMNEMSRRLTSREAATQ